MGNILQLFLGHKSLPRSFQHISADHDQLLTTSVLDIQRDPDLHISRAVKVPWYATPTVMWYKPGDGDAHCLIRGGRLPPGKRKVCLRGYMENFRINGQDDLGLMNYSFCPDCEYKAWHIADSRLNGIHLQYGHGPRRSSKKEATEIEEILAAEMRSKCSVCYDVIGDKNPASMRRFGILSDCQHIFCGDCIRNWILAKISKRHRSYCKISCPLCRTASRFIIESDYWIEDPQQKRKVLTYRSILRRCLIENSCYDCQTALQQAVIR